MTTIQIIVFSIAGLLSLIVAFVASIKIRNKWFDVALALFLVGQVTIFMGSILNLVELNKKPTTADPVRYEKIVLPSDTLYYKIQ